MALKASDKETARAYLLCMGSVLEAVASGNEDGAIQTLREMVGGDDETFEQTLSAHETLAQVVTAGADDEEDFDDEDEDDFDDEDEETADADEDDEDESDDDEEDFDDEDESDDDESEDESDEDDEDDEDEEDEDEEDEDEGGEADLTSTASLISLSDKQRKTRAALISVASQGLTYEDPTHVTASDEDDEDEDFDSDEGDDSEDGLDDIDIPDETVTARVKRAKQKRKGKATASIHKRTKSKNPGGFL